MKIKTADLIGAPLDWAVDRCRGREIDYHMVKGRPTPLTSRASTSGDTVIDIMEREQIEACCYEPEGCGWRANRRDADYSPAADPKNRYYSRFGPTLRIAVCRCYVASKLGDEVEVPEELLS